MNEPKTGGPAFPVLKHYANGHIEQVAEGMTLRDYFAAKAIQGMLASTVGDETWGAPNDAAVTAYVYADAMLKVRQE